MKEERGRDWSADEVEKERIVMQNIIFVGREAGERRVRGREAGIGQQMRQSESG